MKQSVCWIMLLLALLFAQPVAAIAAPDIVRQWAPVVCQSDHSDGLAAKQNVFTLVNYDLDWRLNNNWYNLYFYPLAHAMYYSVVESDTHYYLGYYQYYPRHGRGHEHAMTGVLLAVRKLSDNTCALDLLVTYSNGKWKTRDGGRVFLADGHPGLQLRAGTLAIAAAGKNSRLLRKKNMQVLSPAGSRLGSDHQAGSGHTDYVLLPLTVLWERRQDIGQGRVFSRWGYFDSFNAVRVSAPWAWEYRRLNWLLNPGELTLYFTGQPVKACNYLNHPYQAGTGSK